jgi:hypothetical protein
MLKDTVPLKSTVAAPHMLCECTDEQALVYKTVRHWDSLRTWVLRDDGDSRAQLLERDSGNVDTIDDNRARSCFDHTEESQHEAALSWFVTSKPRGSSRGEMT